MFILGIETATAWGNMALWEDGETLCQIGLKAQKGGGEYLLATLADWLPLLGKELTELDFIAVGTGPGSYTGIRVGMSLAKGLAEGLGIPVYGINTLRVIAENAVTLSPAFQGYPYKSDFEWIVAAIDARRGEVYAACFQNTPDGLIERMAPQPIAAVNLAQELATRSGVIICGDGGKKYADLWQASPNIVIAPRDWDRPQANRLVRLAMALKQREGPAVESRGDNRGGPADDSLKAEYLKKVEAEVRWEAKCK